MTNSELAEWFSESFWAPYKVLVKTPFVTKYKAGPKGEALKIILRLNPSEALRDRISMAIAAQIDHRKKLIQDCGSMQAYLEATRYQKFYANRMGSTWLNQMGWEDEIPSLAETRIEGAAVESAFCATPDCAFPTHGPAFKYCTQCVGRTNDDELKEGLRKMGMAPTTGESKVGYFARCREKSRAALRSMKLYD